MIPAIFEPLACTLIAGKYCFCLFLAPRSPGIEDLNIHQCCIFQCGSTSPGKLSKLLDSFETFPQRIFFNCGEH